MEVIMITRIHVNQHVIKSNLKNNKEEPPLSIISNGRTAHAKTVNILDLDGRPIARIVYSPNKPLSCGARVWIETNNDIEIDNEF